MFRKAPSCVMSRNDLYQCMGELLSASTLPDFTDGQWQEIIRYSGDTLIAAQLHHWLATRGLLDQLDENIKDYLEAVSTLNAERNEQLTATFYRLAETLNGIGVEPIALKGVALLVGSDSAHALWANRISCDVDVLISSDDLAPTLRVLKSQGYRQMSHYIDKEDSDKGDQANFKEIDLSDFRNHTDFTRAHVPPLVDKGSDCPIDLHTAILSSDSPESKQLTALMMEHSVVVRHPDDGMSFRVPRLAAQTVLAVYHSQIKNRKHFLGLIDWRLLMDVWAMFDQHPESGFLEEVMTLARESGVDNEMYTVIALVNTYLDADIDLNSIDEPARCSSYLWFERRCRWSWLSRSCQVLVKVQKSYLLISPQELRHALGGHPSMSDFFAHVSYRIRRHYKS